MTAAASPHGFWKQHGIVLVTGLIILLIMTIVGLTALRSTMLEEKMAGNLKDQNVAFQAAEAALRVGEEYLSGSDLGTFVSDDTSASLALSDDGLYQPSLSTTQQRWVQANIWTDAGSLAYPRTPSNKSTTDPASPAGSAEPPRYIIEDISSALQCTGSGTTLSCAVAPLAGAQAGEDLTFASTIGSGGGYYRITARGVGTSRNTVVFLQSYYNR